MKVLASDYDGTLLFNEKFKEGDLKKIKEFQKKQATYLVYVVEDLLKVFTNFVSLILILISIFYVQEHLYSIKKEKLFIKVRFLNIYYMNFIIVIKKIMIFLFKLICKFIHF